MSEFTGDGIKTDDGEVTLSASPESKTDIESKTPIGYVNSQMDPGFYMERYLEGEADTIGFKLDIKSMRESLWFDTDDVYDANELYEWIGSAEGVSDDGTEKGHQRLLNDEERETMHRIINGLSEAEVQVLAKRSLKQALAELTKKIAKQYEYISDMPAEEQARYQEIRKIVENQETYGPVVS